MHSSFNSQGVFNNLIFKGKGAFPTAYEGYICKLAFFKVLLKVQCSKLFICKLSSQAFDLGLSWGCREGGEVMGEILSFWGMKLIIRTIREIGFRV